MEIKKAFKFRLVPTPDQAAVFRQMAGNTRFIYNHLLEKSIELHGASGKFVLGYDLSNMIPEMKEEFSFLKLSYSQSLQASAENLGRAFVNKFVHKTHGFPKFKKKNYEDSFTYKQNWKLGRKSIVLPKIGRIRMIKHRPIEGKARTVTISQDGDQWFASILCIVQVPDPPVFSDEENFIGIDVGIKEFAVLSTGEVVSNPKFMNAWRKKVRRFQRKLSKKKDGSKNRDRAKKKLQRVHRKIRRQRQDFHDKVSRSIIAKCSGVALENLNIQGMMKNHHLAGAIQDCAWGGFTRRIMYKAGWSGKPAVRVDRWCPSTKMCSACGGIQTMKLSDRVYICGSCGFILDRDLNSALNIRAEGLIILRGTLDLGTVSMFYLPVDGGEGTGQRPVTACGEVGSGPGFPGAKLASGKQEEEAGGPPR